MNMEVTVLNKSLRAGFLQQIRGKMSIEPNHTLSHDYRY